MAQREAILSRKIMTDLRLEGYFCFKIHGGPTMMAGLPDIIVCAEGFFIGLETKMPDKANNTSARQDYVHDEIRKAGGGAYVVTSSAQALRLVRARVEELQKRKS